jgi:hypothetical protein
MEANQSVELTLIEFVDRAVQPCGGILTSNPRQRIIDARRPPVLLKHRQDQFLVGCLVLEPLDDQPAEIQLASRGIPLWTL